MMNMTREVQAFLDRVAEGELAVPECRSCGVTFLPPRALCPECGGSDLGWIDAPQARGVVYSLTRTSQSQKTIVLVDLDVVTGPGRLFVQASEECASDLEIGDRVVIDVIDRENPTGERMLVARLGDAQ